MTYHYTTQVIDGIEYILASQITKGWESREKPDPEKRDYPVAFTESLRDENGNLRWAIDPKDPMHIYEVVRKPTAVQIEAARAASVAAAIATAFPLPTELSLINKGIESVGKDPDYLAYRARVAEIKAATQ